MSANEIALGLAWIDATLRADSTMVSLAPGGFYRGAAPKEEVSGNPLGSPVVIYAYQTGSHKTSFNGYRCLTRALFQIKATGPGDAAHAPAVVAAAVRIDTLFKGPTRGTTTGGLVDSCVGESPLQYDEPAVGGVFQTHWGGIYELLIEQT